MTASSSGIGRATAHYFAQQGWNVAATMRTPAKETELNTLPNVICPALDVTNADSIKSAIAETIAKFGKIDVVVNNAGYGLIGPVEAFTAEQIQRQFQTNVFGVFEVTNQIMPHFRANKAGTVITITSVGGRVTLPYSAIYNSTKYALEGYAEALRYEVEQFGVQVKVVEPGFIKTNFAGESMEVSATDDYPTFRDTVQTGISVMMADASEPPLVAEVIYTAATDGDAAKFQYVAGADAEKLLQLRASGLAAYDANIKTLFGL